MITVTFPKRNRLLQKVFNTIKVYESRDISHLTHKEDVLDVILAYFNFDPNEVLEIKVIAELKKNSQEEKNEQDGQYITIEYDKDGITGIHYVFFSYEFPNETRNGYIVSKLPISYRTFYADAHENKSFNVFLLCVTPSDDIDKNDGNVYEDSVTSFSGVVHTVNDYQTFAYKICRTLNIDIINYNQLDWSTSRANEVEAQTPFGSIKQMKDFRNKMVKTQNKSSYIIENADDTILYGKTFGNNGFEIILMAAAAKAITKGNVYLWQIKDTKRLNGEDRDAKPITNDNLELLRGLGIECFDELRDYTPNEEAIVDGNARNQAEFIKNLMTKYGSDEKKCYLCNCNIQKMIIASHIHRVCDINKEDIPFLDKRAKAISGDNGLWLCANHDKLFEYGMVYFDDNGVMQVSNLKDLTEEQREYVEGITIPNNSDNNSVVIEDDLLTDNMKEFLSIHRHRTHPELD